VGALAAGISIAFVKPITPYALGAGAAFFLYLALADLVPRHRRTAEKSEAVWQAALVVAGAALIWLLPAH
jgi:zinc transporter ZupT